MNSEDRRFWEGLPLSIVAGIILWALTAWWYVTTFGPEAALTNRKNDLAFCNGPAAKNEKQLASCDKLFKRLSCDMAEFHPDFTTAQREACRQARKLRNQNGQPTSKD